jgi:hypothetical protein
MPHLNMAALARGLHQRQGLFALAYICVEPFRYELAGGVYLSSLICVYR